MREISARDSKGRKIASFENLFKQLQEQENVMTTKNEMTFDTWKKIEELSTYILLGLVGITSNFYKNLSEKRPEY